MSDASRLSLVGLLTPVEDWDGAEPDAEPCRCSHTRIAHDRSAECMGWTFNSGSWRPDCECKAFESPLEPAS